jgi:hypothetical protein
MRAIVARMIPTTASGVTGTNASSTATPKPWQVSLPFNP